MQRRTLIRAADLAAFRDALVTRALAGPPLAARRRVVIVPTRAAAELLRQTLEARAFDRPGRGLVLPDLQTREDWLEGLRAAVVLNEAPQLGWLLYSGLFSVLAFLGGWKLFHTLEPAFADRV